MEFLIGNNVVQQLELSKTSCALEKVMREFMTSISLLSPRSKIFDGLLRGCCPNLQHLDVSNNRYSVRWEEKKTHTFSHAISVSYRKGAKDVFVPEAIYRVSPLSFDKTPTPNACLIVLLQSDANQNSVACPLQVSARSTKVHCVNSSLFHVHAFNYLEPY